MLTEAAIKTAKPKDRQYKLYDEKGLFLCVTPAGGRWWRFKYRLNGLEKLLSLGTYPEVSLKSARKRRDDARSLVADKKDPSAKRKEEKGARQHTFEAVAREWLGQQRFTEKTLVKARWMLDDLILPHLGKRTVGELSAADVLDVVRRLEARGKFETAARTLWRVGQILKYARSTDRQAPLRTEDLSGSLAVRPPVAHHAAITEPKAVGELMRAIDVYRGQPATEAALRLAPLLFVRPGELRGARWDEIELAGAAPLWSIPAERMKAVDGQRKAHLVPLSRQAVTILQWLLPITGPKGLVFPNLRDANRPLSEVALTAALRRLGYDGRTMSWHGFRAMARTMLDEQLKYRTDIIEHQLAHRVIDPNGRAYNRTAFLDDRRTMMQAWADYLDSLRALPTMAERPLEPHQ
jgi:integrase